MSVAEKFLHLLARQKNWLPTFVVVLSALFVWSAVGLGPYSGFATPPQFGDFEAQRHWMEITQHLDIAEWYFHDFDWWRLDYPPLTAYHSWLCGKIGRMVNPDWFALYESRGFESSDLKAYMRLTVIASQILLYMWPMWSWTAQIRDPVRRSLAFGSLLLLPSLTIIDHGHFQYNSVMIGLFVASLNSLVRRRFVKASVQFIMALFFKQMSLYYAPVIFTAILGYCIGPAVKWEPKLGQLVKVGLACVITSAVFLLPFMDLTQLRQIIARIFPVFRGLWEDKVANVWCTVNYTVLKLKSTFKAHELQLMALLATLIGIAPSCIAAFVGKPRVWPWAFANCAWAFFLFSFQVHEKSVLLPLIPTLLTAVQHYDVPNITAMSNWISNIAYFSMWPLIKREGLQLQYFVLFSLFNWLITTKQHLYPRNWLNKLVVAASYSGFLALAVIEYFNLAPAIYVIKYPDLFVVGNMALSLSCFIYFWLWQMWYMLTLTTLE